MALIPYALRPSVIIKRNALRKGLLGPSLIWKVVAAWVYGSSSIKKFFGKNDESLGSWNVGSNDFVSVINAKPASKKERKRSGVTSKAARAAIVAAAVADAKAKNPGAKVVVKSK